MMMSNGAFHGPTPWVDGEAAFYKAQADAVAAGTLTSQQAYLPHQITTWDPYEESGMAYATTVITGLQQGDVVHKVYNQYWTDVYASDTFTWFNGGDFYFYIDDYVHNSGTDRIIDWLHYIVSESDGTYTLVTGQGVYEIVGGPDQMDNAIGLGMRTEETLEVFEGATLINPRVSSRGYTYSVDGITGGTMIDGATYINDQDIHAWPNEVWVDDGWTNQNDVDAYDPTLTWQYDAFAVVQDGVDAVATGGTVHVLAGTYREAIDIDKPLSLEGNGSADNADASRIDTTAVHDIANRSSCVAITDGTGHVTITGFRFEGDGQQPLTHAYGDGEAALYFTGWDTLNPITNITVTQNTFAGVDRAIVTGANLEDSVISDNLFEDITDWRVILVQTWNGDEYLDNLRIVGNEIRNSTSVPIALMNYGGSATVGNVLVEGNYIHDNDVSQPRTEGHIWNREGQAAGVGARYGWYNLTVRNNAVVNNLDMSGVGIWGTSQAYTNLTIEDNVLHNNTGADRYSGGVVDPAYPASGIRFQWIGATDDGSTWTVSGNSIDGNSWGLSYDNTPVINAENNWWGSTHGPQDTIGTTELPVTPEPAVADMLNVDPGGQLGNDVSENVDYYPWLSDPAVGDVWVDDDWTSQSDVDAYDPSLTWHVDAFAVVQDGVDMVAQGGTVHVLAGTYDGEIVIDGNDGLTVVGAGEAETIIQATRAFAADNVGLTVRNSVGVTLSDLQIDGFADPSLIAPQAPFDLGIRVEGDGDLNLIIERVTVRNFDRQGIRINSGASYGVTIRDCTITDGTAEQGYSHGIKMSGVGTVDNCTIERVSAGIMSGRPSATDPFTITNNTIVELTGETGSPFDRGISLWCYMDNDAIVTGNVITASVDYAAGMYLVRPGENSAISDNIITLTGQGGHGIETGWNPNRGVPIRSNTISVGRGAAGIVITGAGTETDPMLVSQNVVLNTGADDTFANDYASDFAYDYNPDYPNTLREVGILLSAAEETASTWDAKHPSWTTVSQNVVDGFKESVVVLSENLTNFPPFDDGTFDTIGATIYNNSFTNTGVAIKYGQYWADYNTPEYHYADIPAGDADYPGPVDASGNWLGGSTPAGTAANVIGDVDYTPWLDSGTDTDGGTFGFQGDFSALWVDDDSPQVGATGRIQEGVNLVSGSTVTVAAGIYDEEVTIDKSLTLQGEGTGATVLQGSDAGRGIYLPDQTEGVTIGDMTIRNYQDGIVFGTYGHVITDVVVSDVHVMTNTRHGILSNAERLTNITLTRVNASFNGTVTTWARGVFFQSSGAARNQVTIEDGVFSNNALVGIDFNIGQATDVIITGNTVENNGDAGIGVLGGFSAVIADNVVTDNGRFGIEIKNPDGNGSLIGSNVFVVYNNTVSRTGPPATDERDHGGIVVIRRDAVASDGNPDIPSGVYVISNTVSGFQQPISDHEGFGIVIEGTEMTAVDNTLVNNDVGIQVQAGNVGYPGNSPTGGATTPEPNTDYFDRGNSPVTCATVENNTFSGNTVDSRNIGGGVPTVRNMNTGLMFCTIQSAIDDPETLDGHTILVGAGTYDEAINIEGFNSLTVTGVDSSTVIVQPSYSLPMNVGGYGASRQTAFRVVDSTDVTLQNMTIDLDLVKGDYVFGLFYWDSSGTVDNNVIENNQTASYTEFGAYFRAPGYTDAARADITLSNNVFVDTGRVAAIFHDYVDATITGNTFYKTADDFGYAIELGSESTGIISDNTIYGYDTPAASDGSISAGIYIENAFNSYTQISLMGARWYNGNIGRWISPDTIVSDPANPQSLNRYAYVIGNPLRYTDPTGHAHWAGTDGNDFGWYVAPPGYEFTPEQLVYINKRVGGFERWMSQQWVWEKIPSSVGVYGSGGDGLSIIAGFQFSKGSAWVFNWRSGELTHARSASVCAKLATPEIVGGGVSIGILAGYGYPNNDMLEGYSFEASGSVQADAIGRLGFERGRSKELEFYPSENFWDSYWDPAYALESGMQPYMESAGVNVGWNVFPNAVEGDLQVGLSQTYWTRTYQLYHPFWERYLPAYTSDESK
jgi:RHS repeat-associated protein